METIINQWIENNSMFFNQNSIDIEYKFYEDSMGNFVEASFSKENHLIGLYVYVVGGGYYVLNDSLTNDYSENSFTNEEVETILQEIKKILFTWN